MRVFLDTHVVVVITAEGRKGLPRKVISLLERADEILVSPAVVLELALLREIGRLNAGPEAFIEVLTKTLLARVCDRSWPAIALEATKLTWTRDPFDRFIAAHATVASARLLTKDSRILEHCSFATWD
jgi:PIN domain nuclease of toxin-antitoxin system